MPQYYLDSSNFATATAVYVDAGLTVLAPDGYYSSNGIVRSQVNGQLSAYAECESCKGYQKPVEGELLLDLYPGAVAAFSLNQLSTSYTGAAVRVRRASDSVEQDIGFTSEFVLDVAALDSFCSGTDGFVVTWYNQDGSGNHAAQGTNSRQPKIYDAATGVELENAVPAPLFDGVTGGQGLFGTTISATSSAFSAFAVRNRTKTATADNYLFDSYIAPDRVNFDTSGNALSIGGQNFTPLFGGSGQTLISVFSSSAGTSGYTDGVDKNLTGGTHVDQRIGQFSIGNFVLASSQTGFGGTIQAIIIYNADKSADRAGIENALNQQYNIYWDGTVTALLDDYPGAVGAFSVRALNSFYTGPIMRVRRSSDSAEQDIKALYSGDLDTAALATFCAGTDGFVVTWYNQDGSGNHATQTTTSNQPKIYDASTGLVLDNAIAAFDFNGTSHQLVASVTISSAAASTSFAVVNPDTVTPNKRIYNMHDGAAGDERNSTFFNSQFNIFDGTNGLTTGTAVAGTQYLITSRFVTGDGTIHANGTLQGTSAAITQKSVNTLSIGKQDVGVAFYFDGKIQAVIIYNADKSTDRAAIETALNDYFNIY